jgi:hypothetical protein
MRMSKRKEERKKGEMDWWKERRGTYQIFVTVRLTIRASAILVAPSSPIIFIFNLREGDENEQREKRMKQER